jgi:hypothetical protein
VSIKYLKPKEGSLSTPTVSPLALNTNIAAPDTDHTTVGIIPATPHFHSLLLVVLKLIFDSLKHFFEHLVKADF